MFISRLAVVCGLCFFYSLTQLFTHSDTIIKSKTIKFTEFARAREGRGVSALPLTGVNASQLYPGYMCDPTSQIVSFHHSVGQHYINTA